MATIRGRFWTTRVFGCLLPALLPVLAGNGLFAQSHEPSPREAELQRIAVIEKAIPATVGVFSTDGASGGSGVVLTADGLALTNYHVVAPCGNHLHCTMPDGSLYDAVVVGIDPVGDVAKIKLLGREDFPCVNPGDSDRVSVGDWCFAVGNPFLLATNFQPSVSWGIVSGTGRYQYPSGTLLEYADCLQTDAAINPGNSGGALFNGAGELIGINGRGSFEKRGRVNVGVGYAISINQIKLFRDHLASGRLVDHATLGATVGTDRNGRVVVQDVLATSDAWRRGLRYGDQIERIGDRPVTTVNELKNVLGIYPAGWRLPIEFRRGEELLRVLVRLDGVHAPGELEELVSRGEIAPTEPDLDPDHGKDPEQPEDGNDGGRPEPELPIRLPTARPDIPDSVQAWIEVRPGFANYHFNRLRRDAIVAGFRRATAESFPPGQLQLTCRIDDGSPDVQVSLGVDRSGMRLGDRAHVVEGTAELAKIQEPAGSGGLLAALHAWHSFLADGGKSSGDLLYFGSLPDASETVREVLTGNAGGAQVHFQFDRHTSLMSGMEFWPSPDQDPCEIQFSDWREVNGVQLPHQWVVLCGDHFRQTWTIESYAWQDETKEPD